MAYRLEDFKRLRDEILQKNIFKILLENFNKYLIKNYNYL